MIARVFVSLLLAVNLAVAEPAIDVNATEVNRSTLQEAQSLQQHIVSRLQQLQSQADAIDEEILEKSVLAKIYSNYSTLKVLQKQYEVIEKSIDNLQRKKRLSKVEEERLEGLILESETLKGKLELLSEYEKDPFKKYLEPPKIDDVPTVGNPFAIIGAISYREKLVSNQEEYLARYETLEDVIEKLRRKEKIIQEMYLLSGKEEKYQKELQAIKEEIMTFASVLDIFKTTQNVYSKKVDEIILSLKQQIAEESKKTVYIGGLVLFFLVLLILAKYIVKRYMSD
ncbi:MAG: mechanosensitive ion channel family protein, partial [Sulfurovum sp.]